MLPGNSSLKVGRNAMEKKRRMHMNHLFSILSSLIFTQTSKVSLPVLLEQATNYIKGLKESIEELQRRKEQLKGDQSMNKNNIESSPITLPVLALEEMGSTLMVKLIAGLDKNFMLHQVPSVLEEESVEVVSTSYSTIGDKILYTIHSQAIWSRIGIETSRVQERLNKLLTM
ncbi:transcription factor bHLH167-like [Cornus florida]|uniref:transcription factor bHLH167-like n=1 Tax=Cornus florida TaxID=4283 RepID=UPI0028A2DB97|nr:transcription factor bHLH167-like [Cornus florida]